MIKIKRSTEDIAVWFEWDENLSFKILYQRRGIVDKLRKSSTRKKFGMRGKYTEEPDVIYFSELFVKKAVADWKGMTYKNIQDVCEPLEIEEKDLTKEVKFSEENLELLAQNINTDFSNFVIQGSSFIGEEKEKALKNLEITSDGKETV